jgi:hypothetical protein
MENPFADVEIYLRSSSKVEKYDGKLLAHGTETPYIVN